MNDYVMYELAKQRQADLIDKARRPRPISSGRYPGMWTGVTTSARQRFAVLAHLWTNRTWTPTAEG